MEEDKNIRRCDGSGRKYKILDKTIKVLLIENNQLDARLIQEMLAQEKSIQFKLKCVDCLSRGLKSLAKGGIDVVLLDLCLPENKGLSTVSKVHTQAPQVAIVVQTVLTDELTAVKALQKGAQDYLIKGSVNSDLLVRSLRYSIEHKNTENALRESEKKSRKISENIPEWILEINTLKKKVKQSDKKLQRTLKGVIHMLASTIKTRDFYLAAHQQRVTNLACAIAKELGFSKEQINGIHMAGIIHDLGKIGIPNEILTKNSRLTKSEFNIIKCHSRIGYRILKTIEFPWPIAQIVFQHHERINGSGYPQGLSGKNILIEAKILAVADVVEAMSSHRPYRPPLGIDKALEEISQNRGILYDPEIVDTCSKLFKEKGFKFE